MSEVKLILGFLALLAAIFGLFGIAWLWGEFCRFGMGDDSNDVRVRELIDAQLLRDAQRSPVVGGSRSGWLS